ncbi:MAG TPA: septum formation family protein [Candidatus Limnocylindrales bacterium]|nr:septum formation family protein [Candidatus Limnocylindrales bacterium]
MTDQTPPNVPSSSEPVPPPPIDAPPPIQPPEMAAPPPPAMAVPPPPAPPVKVDKPNPLRIIIILAVIGGFLAFVLWSVRDQQSAGDLAVGTCFDEPAGTEDISTVTKHACTEPHDAEVFHVAEYTGDTYPIDLSMENFVDDVCLPVFETYVGASFNEAQDLNVGWFYPNRNGWDDGDRTVTCYAVRVDAAKMNQSVKGSGGGS